MPYITKTERDHADHNPVYGRGNPGILNYRLTKLLIEWLGKNPRYADFNAVIGALESAKLEMYRRSVAGYEDQAIDRNGDIYPEHLLPQAVEPVIDEPEVLTEDDGFTTIVPDLHQPKYHI